MPAQNCRAGEIQGPRFRGRLVLNPLRLNPHVGSLGFVAGSRSPYPYPAAPQRVQSLNREISGFRPST